MFNILPISKAKSIDRSDAEIKNFWLKREHNYRLSQNNNAGDKIISLIRSVQNGVICIMSEDLSDKRILEAIFSLAGNGNRVYLMSNMCCKALHDLQGCLIRHGLKNIGSLVLVNPNTDDASGLLYTGPFSESALNENILFDLDKEQITVLYRHFCFHFWNTAKKEIIDGQEMDVKAAPIDIYQPVNNFCDPEYAKNELSSLSEGLTVISGSITNSGHLNFTGIKKTTIITSILGNNNGIIPPVKASENTISAIENGVFVNIIATLSNGVWIIPKTVVSADDIFFALKMNHAQEDRINALIGEYKRCANYEFFDTDKRGNLSGKTILPLGEAFNKQFEMKELSEKNLGDNKIDAKLLTYSELESMEPEFPDAGDAVRTEYKWRNVPFYLPQNSVKHELYAQWDKETQKILDALNLILKNIDAADKKESSLSKRITRFFLGKRNTFNRIKDDVEKLTKEQFYSFERGQLEETLTRINEIHGQVANHVAEINEEDRKAKIEEAIEKLRAEIAAHEVELLQQEENLRRKRDEKQDKIESFRINYVERKKSDLRVQLEKLQEQIAVGEERLNKARADLANLEATEKDLQKDAVGDRDRVNMPKIGSSRDELQKKAATLETELERLKKEFSFHDAKKADRMESFSKDYSADSKGLAKIRSELEEKAGKKRREKNPDEAQTAEVLLKELDGFKSFDTFISKTEEDIKKVKKEIQSKQDDIVRKEDDKKKPPVQSGVKKNTLGNFFGGKTAENTAQAGQKIDLVIPTIPRLPKIGKLYQGDNRAYLAIKEWEEFEPAQKEAERLRAILCAERSENG